MLHSMNLCVSFSLTFLRAHITHLIDKLFNKSQEVGLKQNSCESCVSTGVFRVFSTGAHVNRILIK